MAELPSLSWLAETRGEAFEGIQRLAEEVIRDLEANGELVPEALADRTYSRAVIVRVRPRSTASWYSTRQSSTCHSTGSSPPAWRADPSTPRTAKARLHHAHCVSADLNQSGDS